MADKENNIELAAIEDDLRDPSKMACPTCSGTGDANAPPGFRVLIPICTTCHGAGLISRGETGPYILVTSPATHARLINYPYVGAYRKRLILGWESMDGKTVPPMRQANYSASYKRSRDGLIQSCFQLKLPFAFLESPVDLDWAPTTIVWVIGKPPGRPCAKFSLLRMDYGDWCKTCGWKAELH